MSTQGDKGDTGLTGLQGETGHAGTRGDTGSRGITGDTGTTGLTGLTGLTGITGLTGTTGASVVAGERGQRGKTGTVQTKLDRYALFIVVVLTALSAIYFATVSQHRLTDANHLIAQGARQQQAADVSAACRQKVFEDTVIALKSRSTFAETQARALLNLDQAQQTYLSVVGAQPPPLPADAYAALAEYQKALSFSIAATRDQLRIKESHPYPTAEQVKACR
jgi:hypothetical protein